MKQFLSDRRGEGYVSSAVKIIIAIVIGALLLGGLYLLFRPDDGIVTKNMKDGVDSMINFTPELRMKTMQDTPDSVVYLAFSYDGNYWSRSFVPDYGENATVTKVMENGSEGNADYRGADSGRDHLLCGHLHGRRNPFCRAGDLQGNRDYALLFRNLREPALYLRFLFGGEVCNPLPERVVLHNGQRRCDLENTDLVGSDSDRLIGTDGTLQIGVPSGLKEG